MCKDDKVSCGIAVAAIIICIVYICMTLMGCASGINAARQAIRANAQLVGATAGMMVELDQATQEAIAIELVKTSDIAKAKADLEAWRAKRETIKKAVKITGDAVIVANSTVDLIAQGAKFSINDAIGPLIKAAIALTDALRVAGIQLPKGFP